MSATEPPVVRPTKPTPRVAGVTLIVLSTAAGAFAAISISSPLWAVPAAILLAFAGVGITAGLLLLQRTSWADPAWPPGHVIGSWDAKRLRRLTLGAGLFLLTMSAVAVVGIVIADGDTGVQMRGWWIVGTFGVIGVAFVTIAFLPSPPAVDSSERPDDDPSLVDAAWVRLSSGGSAPSLQGVIVVVLGYQLLQVPVLLLALLPIVVELGTWTVALMIAFIAVAVVVTAIVIRRRRRPTWVAWDGSALRRGSREVRASEVTSATCAALPWQPDATARSLTITLSGTDRFRATVGLRVRGRLVLTDTATEALAKIVSQSSIELPRDTSDPKGRFSKALYPNNLTKAEALALIEHPPGDGEPLPIAAPPGQH